MTLRHGATLRGWKHRDTQRRATRLCIVNYELLNRLFALAVALGVEPFALFEKDVEDADNQQRDADYPEVVEIVSRLIFGETYVAHYGEVDEQDDRNQCGSFDFHGKVEKGLGDRGYR